MPDNLDKIFDPQRLKKNWGALQQDEPQAVVAEELSALQLLENFQTALYGELPARQTIFQPLLAKAQQLLVEQEHGSLDKAGLQKNQAALQELLEQLEDILDAFMLT